MVMSWVEKAEAMLEAGDRFCAAFVPWPPRCVTPKNGPNRRFCGPVFRFDSAGNSG